MSKTWIIHGDCMQVLPMLPAARMVFLDPPDNLGVKYDGYEDRREPLEYLEWLMHVLRRSYEKAPIVWRADYDQHSPQVMRQARV